MFSRSALLISLVLILALVAGIYFASGATFGAPQFDTSKTVFFSSNACAECLTLENRLAESEITEKFAVEIKRVETPLVQAELYQAASICRFGVTQGISLPLLFAGGECTTGATDIQNYFTSKLNRAD